MRKLIMGIVDFRERMLPQYERRFEALALTQAPDALTHAAPMRVPASGSSPGARIAA